ncbi:hypothetical protein GCM10011507_12290 [Edaphobacter acidisoli]|uniref:Uncharacterized protein n=1 Tax=Edaphobacter acidisoli TaxID=2040573 RepID=A0A916W326_9BACT|nr:hypothetical protein [Edaphobacter acidisoli]GGA62308.1 hypothetical protein GCM10011507_12290 [Edaphobacter acidisoli]
MPKTALLLASLLLLYPTAAKAQAAAEAGMLTGAVSGITSATSHKMGVSNLDNKTGGKVTEVTNTHRTTPRHARTTAQKKTAPTTTASTATHTTKPQGHIVGVWPPNALTSQAQPQ